MGVKGAAMKRILFLMNTLTGGGAEKVLVDIVNNLDKDKFDVTLQTICDVGIYKDALNEKVRYKTIIKSKNIFWRKVMGHVLLKRMSPRHFYKMYVDDNYDIEVAFLEGIPTKILAASDNPNKFAWVHIDLYNYYGQTKMFRSVQQNAGCYKRFKKIFCVSQSAKEGFKKRFGFDENVEVLYNPVDENIIKEKANEPITEVEFNDKFKIITVGRLVHQKGYDRLMRVHKRLITEGYDYELWILGEGSERSKLEKYIYENDLCNSVRLLGFHSNPYKFVKKADLFICSSRAEGFSLVVAEALVLGCPVISTNCSGPNELLDESKYGLLVENNEEGIYAGIKTMLTDREKLLDYKKRAQIRGDQFSLKERIRELENKFNI